MAWAEGITEVKYVTGYSKLGKSPAAVDPKSGIIYVNLPIWRNLPKEHRIFVLLHEWAHVKLKSTDELAVDALAHKEYMKLGYSLTQSIHALTKVLSFSGRKGFEQILRANAQLERAKAYDAKHNGNIF